MQYYIIQGFFIPQLCSLIIEIITWKSLKDYLKSLRVINLLAWTISRRQLSHSLRNDSTLMAMTKAKHCWFREIDQMRWLSVTRNNLNTYAYLMRYRWRLHHMTISWADFNFLTFTKLIQLAIRWGRYDSETLRYWRKVWLPCSECLSMRWQKSPRPHSIKSNGEMYASFDTPISSSMSINRWRFISKFIYRASESTISKLLVYSLFFKIFVYQK